MESATSSSQSSPVDEFMKVWLADEHKIDEEFNKITEYNELQARLNKEIKETQQSLQDTNMQIKNLNENIVKLSGENTVIQIKFDAFNEVLEKEINECSQIEEKTETLQRSIWKLIQEYCDEVKSFSKNYGINATMKTVFEKQVRQQLATALDDIEIHTEKEEPNKRKCEEITKMDSEISEEKKILEDLEEKLKNLRFFIENLDNEINSAECVSLRNALKYSRDETAKYQAENEDLRLKLDTVNTSIINKLFDDNMETNSNLTRVENMPSRLETLQSPFGRNNHTDFRTAKNVFMGSKYFPETRTQPQKINNTIDIPKATTSQYEVMETMDYEVTENPSSSNNFGYSGNMMPPTTMRFNRLNPYKEILDMKQKFELYKQGKKGKFKLTNNFK